LFQHLLFCSFLSIQQLAALLITRQVIGNIKEALIPYIIEKAKQFRIGYKMSAKLSPDTLDKAAAEIMNRFIH